MVDSSLFLEKVKEIARNQFKIETARKSRIEKLMKENERLREESDTLKKKIRDCEAQRRKRMILIKELRTVHDNAQRGIFADKEVQKPVTEPPVQSSVPQTSVVTPDRFQRPDISKEPQDKNSRTSGAHMEADPSIVAQAQANTASRNKVVNPCRFARSGDCRYGVRCRASHNVLPDSYCAAYNAVGTCVIPNCTRLHTLYSYTVGTSMDLTSASSSEQKRVEGGNRGRYAGGSRWK